MAEPTRCPRCALRAFFLTTESGTAIELSVKPSPAGCWTIRENRAVVAVTFAAGKVTGRAPGFEKATLYEGHYSECALSIGGTAESRPNTGTR